MVRSLLPPQDKGPAPSQGLGYEAEADNLQNVFTCHRTWLSWSGTGNPTLSRVIPQESLELQPQCLGLGPKPQPVAP